MLTYFQFNFLERFKTTMNSYIERLPKAELHLHIEGSLEPQLLIKLAKKNNIELKYNDEEELRSAYKFTSLQSFLDIYYEGMNVLRTREDFYQLASEYIKKCKQNNIVHAEIFFDPQAHLERGISFEQCFMGIYSAFEGARKSEGFSFAIIMCFLRHLSEEDAIKTLELSLPFKDKILAIGLDSTQVGNPPAKFQNVYNKARQYGFRAVAHAGEEGPKTYIEDSINLLKVERIDHGIRCEQCEDLMKILVDKQIPLTLCPLSNLKLAVIEKLTNHNLKKLMDKGILVTINSDDPAYFGGYLNENFIQISQSLKLTKEQIKKLARNSFKASFLSDNEKQFWFNKIEQVHQ